MQSTTKAGYKHKISSYFIKSFDKEDAKQSSATYDASTIDVDLEEFEIRKYVVALQAAWRSRTARIMVGALKQEANCVHHRNTHPELHPTLGSIITECTQCAQGDTTAELKHKINRQKFMEIERLLFAGQKKVIIYDTGENWNQRYQKIIALPENTQLERSSKYIALNALNKDFVSTAQTYAKTIISEYFLHVKDKGIVCKNMGGFAGGQKYLWRGILFKMADGSNGPFNGSDEAAAKAAGHDLKGSVHYSSCGVKELHVPLIALIDYKGFRMSAQAFLPLGSNSMVYGSADAGATVLNSSARFNAAMEKAAVELNIRKHVVGRRGQQKELHAAIDVEGHIGMDNRLYLLDLSRTFPPESPVHTRHLSDIYADGSRVLIEVPAVSERLEKSKQVELAITNPTTANNKMVSATIHNAYAHGEYYDILCEDGTIVHKFPACRVHSKGVSIYWRFLRPEYVKYRGRDLVPLTVQDVVLGNKAALASNTSTDIETHNLKIETLFRNGPDDNCPVNDDDMDATHSLCYDDFSTDVGSLDYDDFSSSDLGDIDSLCYDDFDSSVAGSLEYNDFSSSCNGSNDSDCGGLGSCAGLHFCTNDGSNINCGIEHEEALRAAYDVFDAGYGAFSELVHDDVMRSSGSDTISVSMRGLGGDFQTTLDSHSSTPRDIDSHDSLQPKPLSSDALSSFSNLDPEALERNREIHRATQRLVVEVIPALASRLAAMAPSDISRLDLSVYFHACGVNMRHLGLVRYHISSSHTATPVRTLLLLQIVTRTLKNIAREYQRRWMKSEQSTSEMGMKLLLTQFLNLIVGSSQNSEVFWTERVVVGIIQRFGACSIDSNIEHLHRVRKLPDFLKAMLKMFISMIGLTLHVRAMNQFLTDPNPYQFEFIVQDIRSLEPTVKCMHTVDYGTGLMLRERAEEGYSTGNISQRLLQRIEDLSNESFSQALKVMPSHVDTVNKIAERKKSKNRDTMYCETFQHYTETAADS